MTETTTETTPANTAIVDPPKRQRRRVPHEPEGAWDWLRANQQRMRQAYEETGRLDFVLWFSARAGVSYAAILKALVLIVLAVLVEMRRALRGEPPTHELGDDVRLPMMLDDFEKLDEAPQVALKAVMAWSDAPVYGLTEEQREAFKAHIHAAYERAGELYEEIGRDLEAGRLVDMHAFGRGVDNPHVQRLRVQIAVRLAGDLVAGCGLASDLGPERSIGNTYQWLQFVTMVGRFADAAAAGWGADFARGLIPWETIPDARAWDHPAPGGRSLMDGEPSYGDASDVSSWTAMALAVGEGPMMLHAVWAWMVRVHVGMGLERDEIEPVIRRLAACDPLNPQAVDVVGETLSEWADLVDPIPDDEELTDELCEQQWARATSGLVEELRAALPKTGAAIEVAAGYRRSLETAEG